MTDRKALEIAEEAARSAEGALWGAVQAANSTTAAIATTAAWVSCVDALVKIQKEINQEQPT